MREKEKKKCVRLPYQLWKELKRAATENERSIAEEIAAQILQTSIRKEI